MNHDLSTKFTNFGKECQSQLGQEKEKSKKILKFNLILLKCQISGWLISSFRIMNTLKILCL